MKPLQTSLVAQSQCGSDGNPFVAFGTEPAEVTECCWHAGGMLSFFIANIQVKNVPEKLHNRLRRYAREQACTLGDIILEAIEREVSRRE